MKGIRSRLFNKKARFAGAITICIILLFFIYLTYFIFSNNSSDVVVEDAYIFELSTQEKKSIEILSVTELNDFNEHQSAESKEVIKEIKSEWSLLVKGFENKILDSDYASYDLDTLELLSLNGDGTAALLLLKTKTNELSYAEQFNLIDKAIKERIPAAYFMATVVTKNHNEKLAYMYLAAEHLQQVRAEDIERILSSEVFVPKPDMSEVIAVLSGLREKYQ
jgi:hypothetical protein